MNDSSIKQGWKWLQDYARTFNPWPNVRVMGTNVSNDLLAGLTVAVIALPLALAFGVASGLGPEAGMWAAICGGLFVGIFGGSKVGMSGPTGPKVVQLAAIVEMTRLANGAPDAKFIFTLIFLSGVICVLLAFLKVGRFIYYVPYSAVSGFMCGIGAIIILLEIPPMLGFATPSSVIEAIKQIPYDVLHENPQALIVSVSTFLTILLWPRFAPVKWLPGPLMGLIVGTSIAYFGGFDIAYIGAMPTGLPQIHLPDLGLLTTRFNEMIGPAFALAGLCVFDSLLTCLVADNMTDDRHHSDQEIFGQGVANLMCGLVGGVTTATATMRTVANIKCGGRTGLASITHGVVLLALMLGLAPLASHIPMACLAGILLKVGIDIIDYRVLPVLHRLPIADAICFWAVLGLTISVDLLVAMGVGITIAFVRAIHELGNLYEQEVITLNDLEYKWPGEETMPSDLKERVLKLRLEGPMFFGVSDIMYRTISELSDFDYLIIRMMHVPMVDMSGAYLLDDIVEKAKSHGAHVLITGMRPEVRVRLEKLKIIEKVGKENCFETFEASADRVKELELKKSDLTGASV
ncbi:MAG: SulP family inorganic anion transporter [Planctomicrobium sp.]|jgi:sulfate permease, SulP family|nr:SulP family inorganic anion transporter [Planctomicrobium sp.]